MKFENKIERQNITVLTVYSYFAFKNEELSDY